ncbi:hypothetical protein QMA80_07315 [Burkholderia pseudomallei]|uniref:hypothetical protein n=1 Tax=Burkholderia pseudomallei TaxID=28450 RepID=UPI002DBBBF75|nr:hypothetical protein [Burkholderia pseudomallei]MEB5488026.1 hypothetical protein [Burkholderia pseudomallei]MEB5490905.1 hypothetical protein [Burkholderia pseudomallei]MEB5496751.1 hypothetical protein [Burkholderia pseudomallei]MEB5512341.1 hypothetical protein [Burkholderia pseudomallei]
MKKGKPAAPEAGARRRRAAQPFDEVSRDGAARDAAVRRRRGPDTDARSRRERSTRRPGGRAARSGGAPPDRLFLSTDFP